METRGRSFSKSRIVILIFFLFFLTWTLLQFLGPLTINENTINDLTGLVGVTNNKDTTDDLSAPWSFVYKCGDSLCHQKASRSFFINGNQMPFCSRCTAIWLGLAIGLGFMLFYKIELNEKFVIFMIIGLIPIGFDGVGQLLGLWESNNFVRVVTGLPIGIISGIAIGIIIDELSEIVSSIKTKSS